MLAQYGSLGSGTFDCKRCLDDDCKAKAAGLQSARDVKGCGKPPVTRTGETWNPDEWMEENGRDDAPYAPYRWANLGNVGRIHGWLWPWCPQWFLQFADNETLGIAIEAVEMYDWLELGALQSYQAGELSAAMAELVVTAKRQRNHCQNEMIKRESGQ